MIAVNDNVNVVSHGPGFGSCELVGELVNGLGKGCQMYMK
jgi:hypothetical protein